VDEAGDLLAQLVINSAGFAVDVHDRLYIRNTPNFISIG
jgi:hypothetical protein